MLVVEQQANHYGARNTTCAKESLLALRRPTRDLGDAMYLVCYGNQNRYRTQ